MTAMSIDLAGAFEPQAALDEFLDIHIPRALGVQKLEERPSVDGLELEKLKQGLHVLVLELLLKLVHGKASSLAQVQGLEELLYDRDA
eukprot:CAMPEP_0117488108 /NCGR_PEP_ID=MMETSP0784-20121206/16342_1 /TAXON_ID=39447 /ORGANISM="" /LENGTH=87 /DNA_ID=CAMNT_0005282779 /DNA_START=724 /DNA_END=983 /DNA_ORIENTATION=-